MNTQNNHEGFLNFRQQATFTWPSTNFVEIFSTLFIIGTHRYQNWGRELLLFNGPPLNMDKCHLPRRQSLCQGTLLAAGPFMFDNCFTRIARTRWNWIRCTRSTRRHLAVCCSETGRISDQGIPWIWGPEIETSNPVFRRSTAATPLQNNNCVSKMYPRHLTMSIMCILSLATCTNVSDEKNPGFFRVLGTFEEF